MKPLAAILLALLLAPFAAADERSEAALIAEQWGAAREVTATDGTRADLIHDGYAIEVEWSHRSKWYQAIGQSLHYADVFSLKPGIVLLRHPKRYSERDEQRCRRICEKYGIKLWVFDAKVTN